MNIAFIGIGSNLGDKEKNCIEAVRLLEKSARSEVLKRSSLYNTPPYGFEDQDRFVNEAIKLKTDLCARDLFRHLKSIEKAMGREDGPRWGPRIIDLDLLFYNSLILNSEDLTIPHQGIVSRRFVLEPLAEIEGEWVHPLLHRSVADLLSELVN